MQEASVALFVNDMIDEVELQAILELKSLFPVLEIR